MTMMQKHIEVYHDSEISGLFVVDGSWGGKVEILRIPHGGKQRATKKLCRVLEVAEVGSRMIDTEVLCCQSALVGECMQGYERDGWRQEDIENLCPNPEEWTLQECRDRLYELGVHHDSTHEIEDMRKLVCDNDEPAEILEWWLITPWLCRHLREIGECVIDNDYGYWWGRQCSGQSIKLDPTFYRIAETMID